MVSRKGSDRGGWAAGDIDRSSHRKAPWEFTTDAILMTLARKGVVTIDEHRRTMEEMPPARYDGLSYYQRWIGAIEALMIEKGIATREEIDSATSS